MHSHPLLIQMYMDSLAAIDQTNLSRNYMRNKLSLEDELTGSMQAYRVVPENRTMSYLRTESKLDKLLMHAMAVLSWLEKYAIQGEAQCHNTINIILIQNDSQLEMSRQGIKHKRYSCLCIYKTGICWCYIKSIGQNSRETFRRSRLSFPQKLLLN